MIISKQIKWYLKNLFLSPEYLFFIFIFIFLELNIGNTYFSTEGISLSLSKLTSTFWVVTPFQHGVSVIIFIGYVSIILFTHPFESGTWLFEMSLPLTKGRNFLSKYISGIVFATSTLFFIKTLTIFIKTNEIFGFNTTYPYLYMLSIFTDVAYVFSFFIFWGLFFKKSTGILVGIISLYIIENYLILPLNIWLPPIIYGHIVRSLGDFFHLYSYEIPLIIFYGALSYILYRRSEG